MRFSFPFTDRQKRMMESRARILHIGAGTKTGKSAALFCWLIEGLLSGQACVYVGPWFFRSRRAFDEIKLLLEPWVRSRDVRVNEARLQITSSGGGYLDFVSADNPSIAFGGNYDRVVVDEASRCPSEIYPAALTTISATGGKLRLAFNLELGNKNWAIANLLRVQRLSPEERERTGEDVMTFPTGGDGLVDPALIETLRSQMPEPLWRALYLGVVPDSDCSLFRNLDRIFTGEELEGPEPHREYVMAADLARKTDWTVLSIIDDQGHVVASDRFHQMSWSLQVERSALWYRTFGCRKVIVDSTGVGDAVAEEFEKQGMNVEPFIFTVPSRRALIEELVLACDNREITIPATPKFQVYRQELESMEYQLDGTTVRYAVSGNVHDDAVMSLALAVHAFRASRGAVLGVLLLLERRAKEIAEGIRDHFGELIHKPDSRPRPIVTPKLQPPAATTSRPAAETFTCPACSSRAAVRMGAPGNVHCNQCGADFDAGTRTLRAKPGDIVIGTDCCGAPLPVTIGNMTKCNNCGRQSNVEQPRGMSRAEYAAQRSYGRFG